ncbi:MAG: hypothetical protein ABII82_20335, partial [Verrucomicrobiota bacterium]
ATAADFARALTRLLRDPALARRRRAGALKTAARFDRRRTTAKLLRLYRRLVRERRRRDDDNPVEKTLRPMLARLATEGAIIADKTGALLDAFTGDSPRAHGAA